MARQPRPGPASKPRSNSGAKPFFRKGPKPAPPKPTGPRAKPSEDGLDRLHVRIAKSGMCSRRAAEQLIREGRVSVNGEMIHEMGVKVAPSDEVAVDGIALKVAKTYTVVLNKPAGTVTTLMDPQRRPTI